MMDKLPSEGGEDQWSLLDIARLKTIDFDRDGVAYFVGMFHSSCSPWARVECVRRLFDNTKEVISAEDREVLWSQYHAYCDDHRNDLREEVVIYMVLKGFESLGCSSSFKKNENHFFRLIRKVDMARYLELYYDVPDLKRYLRLYIQCGNQMLLDMFQSIYPDERRILSRIDYDQDGGVLARTIVNWIWFRFFGYGVIDIDGEEVWRNSWKHRGSVVV